MTEKNAKINLFDRTTGFSPLSDTLGQLARPIQALSFMDTQPITNWSTAKAQGIEDQLQQVADDYEAMDPDLDVNVYYGSSPSLEDTVRSAFSKDRNLFSNLLSVPETPEAANDIPEVKAASFRSSLPLFKQAEREANAAMMKELQAEGNMEPVIAGMDPEEIDPEVAAAINEILMQLGNNQEEVPEESSESFETGEAGENDEQDEKHTVEKASSLLPLFERINVYGR
jgi:hypothetical protein